MNVSLVLDIINLSLIFIGILILLSSGLLSKHMDNKNSLVISFVSIYTIGFIIANLILNILYIRIIVMGSFLFIIIPIILSYLIIWAFSREKTTRTRLFYSTFISWLISLTILSLLRLILGWGFESGIALFLLGILLSTIIGLLSGFVGNYLIYKYEKINPSILLKT